MILFLLTCTLQIWLGIDPKQIRNFKTMSKTRQEEILGVFPVPASTRHVGMGACLIAVSNVRFLPCFTICTSIYSKKRKANDKEKGEGGTKKKPKEDPKEKVLRVSHC